MACNISFDMLGSRQIKKGDDPVQVAPTAHDRVLNNEHVFMWRNPEGRSDFGLAGLWAQPGDCLAINVFASFVALFTAD